MSRVKLFNLAEDVQAIAVKGVSESDLPSIMVSIYAAKGKDYFQFAFESIHPTDEDRDKNFDEDHTAQLIRIYNKSVLHNEFPLDLIPEIAENMEVKEPQILK